jgi:hypothetical protein
VIKIRKHERDFLLGGGHLTLYCEDACEEASMLLVDALNLVTMSGCTWERVRVRGHDGVRVFPRPGDRTLFYLAEFGNKLSERQQAFAVCATLAKAMLK